MAGSKPGECGFTMVEVVVAFAIVAIVSALSIGSFSRILPQIRADAGEEVLLTRLRSIRDAAMTQRVNYRVDFSGTDALVESHLQNGSPITETVTLPYSMQFMVFPGLPDTPDGFGSGLAIDFNGGVDSSLIFQGDGSIVDLSGNLVNGTVFIGITGNTSTARAVTVLGATGRIRGYRYDGTSFE